MPSMFDLPRSWYMVPYYASYVDGRLDEEGIGQLGESSEVVKAVITERPLQVQAYDRDGGRCLVGTFGPMSYLPSGWQVISVFDAKVMFEVIKKRPPTVAEVS